MEELLLNSGTVDDKTVYVMTMAEADFGLLSDLQTLLGPDVVFSKPATFKYFVYKSKGKGIVIPSHPIGRMPYNKIYNKGAVFGTSGFGVVPQGMAGVPQTFTFAARNGKTYLVRLMEGVPKDTYAANTNIDAPDFSPTPEFDYFVHNLWILDEATKTRIHFKDLNVPEGEKVAKANYTGNNSRSWALVKGSSAGYANVRARFDTTYPDTATYPFKFSGFNNQTATLASTNGVWWPVFEEV
ncbi:putative vision structural protein [Salmonella phage GEC_vB_MG]|nr:putative vision structural protein [Salmonella phage GEC_vB_MG]